MNDEIEDVPRLNSPAM